MKAVPLFILYSCSTILLIIAWFIFKKLINDHFYQLNELEEEIEKTKDR